MTLRSRSCVMGRGVATFSIWRAMAFASATPTQMGSTREPSLSRRITIGRLVAGSIISVLTVISICIATSLLRHYAHAARSSSLPGLWRHDLAPQAVGICARDAYRHEPADRRPVAREVDHRVSARTPRKFPVPPAAAGVHQYPFDASDRLLVQPALNLPLQRLKGHDASGLLGLRDVVRQPLQCKRVRPR